MYRNKVIVQLFAGVLLSAATLIHGSELAAARETATNRSVNISGNSGGAIGKYALRTAKFRKSGSLVRFTGRCDSACTLFLSLPRHQMCITKGAYFRFHAPTHRNPRAAAAAKRYMLKKYPGWVRSFIANRNGLSRNLVTMDYKYASRFIPTCGGQKIARR